jgi:transposase-like protein
MNKDTISAWYGGRQRGRKSIEEVVRIGAQELIRRALEYEMDIYMEKVDPRVLEDGRAEIVRNGHHRQREVLYSGGSVSVTVPRTRNRRGIDENFESGIIPAYRRRTLELDEAIPMLYLKGISTGDMWPALQQLLGETAAGLSAATVSRLKRKWEAEHQEWSRRGLSGKRYCYVWVDGIHTNVRFSEERLCVLVVIGADEDGAKELLGVYSGYRESGESWKDVLRDLKQRGLNCPSLFIGDGALGFWQAAREVYPKARWQRCWVHKTRNILSKLPKSQHGKAKGMLHQVYLAENQKEARGAAERFCSMFGDKYPKAAECLSQDLEHLLTFYDYPAAHWQHIRSTNVIESVFATVRLRTEKTRGQGTESSTLAMVFKLLEATMKRVRRLRGYRQIPKVLAGVVFVNGVQLRKAA